MPTAPSPSVEAKRTDIFAMDTIPITRSLVESLQCVECQKKGFMGTWMTEDIHLHMVSGLPLLPDAY